MTQNPPPTIPPTPPEGFAPGPLRANGFAVASLVFAIAGFCAVFLGGTVAIVLGFIGLRRSRQPGVGGRRMAVAGIVIGVLSVLTSTTGAAAILYAWLSATEKPRAVAKLFVQDLATGNTSAAAAECTTDVSKEELAVLSSQLQRMGGFKDMRSSQISINANNGNSHCSLQGTAHFASGDLGYTIDLARSMGIWKVSHASFP